MMLIIFGCILVLVIAWTVYSIIANERPSIPVLEEPPVPEVVVPEIHASTELGEALKSLEINLGK